MESAKKREHEGNTGGKAAKPQYAVRPGPPYSRAGRNQALLLAVRSTPAHHEQEAPQTAGPQTSSGPTTEALAARFAPEARMATGDTIPGLAQARQVAAIDVADLRTATITSASLLLAIVCLTVGWFYLPGLDFHWQPCLLFFLMFCVAMVAFSLRQAGAAAAYSLVLGAYALAWCGALLHQPLVALLLLEMAVILSTTGAWPWAPPLAACGSCAMYLAMSVVLGPQPALGEGLLAFSFSGWLLYIVTNSSDTVLRWSWSRHAEAHGLAEQLRDRQEELNHTLKALDLAYRLLQRTNHELAEARQEADESRRLKEQFAANISHELRTPLNVILGFSEIMHLSPHVYGDMEWTPALRRDVGQTYAASRHLLQLVDDVLDLSRLNAEAMPLRKQLVDLGALVEEVVGTGRDLAHAGEAGRRDLTIDCELDSTLPRLYLDETRIREVILNLVNNAVRYTERGRILVRTQRRERDALVSVEDTGVGIPAEELESIFDEFHQVDAGSRQLGGIGLGLAISKRFVQLHGGRIWAESRLGDAGAGEDRGSTFYVSLPLGEAPGYQRLRTSRPAVSPPNPYADSVVLLADTGRPLYDVTRLLQRHLGGMEVLQAASWQEAMDLAERHHSRAILRNASLRELSALLATALPGDARPAAGQLGLPVPVIYTTIPCSSWRAELMGVAGSLQKPVHRDDLLALLATVAGGRDSGAMPGDVLIVDDDRGFVQMLARLLEAEGGARGVRWAYGGEEGLNELRRCRPDVLILDLALPDMSGTTVLATMRAEGLDQVPTIVVTALDVEQDLGGFSTGCLGLAQLHGWSVGDSLKSLQGLLEHTRAGWAEGAAAT